MKSAILTVGTEILFGQIVNTNAAYLSQQLNGLGFDVLYHFTVGDNPDRLKRALETCAKECDLIITTGGLGPTQDDLTKEVISEFAGCRLTINQEAMERIEGYFKRSGREMTENNVKQAYVPEGAICMQNDHGSAPGFICKVDNRKIMSFPGPPKEMMPMFENSAIPYLSTMSEGVIYSKFIKTVGIGESLLETEIMDIVDAQTDPTIATYAKDGEVTMRLTSKRSSAEEAKAAVDEMATKVHERVGNYIYTEDERSFSEVILDKMRDKGLSLSSAESCTGGLFADAFISIPGSSDVFDRTLVTYSNTAKMQELGVKEETLAKTKDVHLRMNETEYDLLAERAKANSMTVSDFIRNALVNQKVIIKYEITADVPEIKKLISEFGKIGSNLNQIARYFNQGGILSSEMRNEIRKSLRDIYEMKYEVMKMAGDFRGSN